MSLPYFPMYPSDFEAKTSHLTLTEDGAYNRLLRLCWMTPGCDIPADEAWVMRRARAVTDDDKLAVLTILGEFFTVKNGRYSNAKLKLIFGEVNEAHQKRVSAGSKGGKAKSLKSNNSVSSNATAKPKQPEPEPEPYKKEDTNVSLSVSPPAIDEIAKSVSAYNATAARVGWPIIQKLSPARRTALTARLKDAGGADGWDVALAKAEASPFLTGQTSKPFTASFDFLTKQSNFTKLMEGNYDPRNSNEHSPSGRTGHGIGSGTADAFAAVAANMLQRQSAGY
jgi:uncharacterized protein YdaU (DUF1376 family)